MQMINQQNQNISEVNNINKTSGISPGNTNAQNITSTTNNLIRDPSRNASFASSTACVYNPSATMNSLNNVNTVSPIPSPPSNNLRSTDRNTTINSTSSSDHQSGLVGQLQPLSLPPPASISGVANKTIGEIETQTLATEAAAAVTSPKAGVSPRNPVAKAKRRNKRAATYHGGRNDNNIDGDASPRNVLQDIKQYVVDNFAKPTGDINMQPTSPSTSPHKSSSPRSSPRARPKRKSNKSNTGQGTGASSSARKIVLAGLEKLLSKEIVSSPNHQDNTTEFLKQTGEDAEHNHSISQVTPTSMTPPISNYKNNLTHPEQQEPYVPDISILPSRLQAATSVEQVQQQSEFIIDEDELLNAGKAPTTT